MHPVSCRTLLALLPLVSPALVRADDSPEPPAQSAPGTLPRVTITGSRVQEENYRVPKLDSLGPLGTTPILDQPYSIGILPLDLIQNSQGVDFKDVSKYLPLVAYQEQQGPDILRPQTRGMQGGNFQNTRVDGMMVFITVAMAMEEFEQIEVVNGPTSALYGPANPAGMFNFVSKRPAPQELREVSATYNSDNILTAHADLSGRIDRNGVISYRLNALFGEGDGYVTGSHQRRALGDLGLDFRPWEHSVLELNYSDYSLLDRGYPGWFTYGESRALPPAPDPQRVGYGQEYAGVDLRTRILSGRFKHDFSSDWHLVIGALNQDCSRDINTPVNNLTSNTGTYVSSFANGFAPRFIMTSDSAYLNGHFDTGPLAHDLTLGTAGYRAQTYSVIARSSPASVLLGTASIAAPAIFPEPAAGPPDVRANFDSSDTYQQGVNAGDTIRLSERWLTRLGISQDWFRVNNYNARSLELPGYTNRGASPAASLIFKPVAEVTTYFTYASSLQAGDQAPGTTVNAGQSLAPYRSKEYELGYKQHFTGLDVTAAVFRIERPFANIDPADNVFKISGQQVNKGLELSAVGAVARGLTLFGGFTLLDARLEHTPLASTNDKLYVGAPKVKGNALLEYQIAAIPGLVASFDYQFSGPRAADDTNSFTAAGYNLFDVGARYVSSIANRPVTWRLAVDNVTDRNYWSTVAPSNLSGANTGSLVAHLGAPRTVLASVSVDL
ncbi:MAG TPA: TonB-dependent receptor [Steroidobacteraceae bacterium]|nr:TonB-dependent receptor [Steroidobacteraceae bacterium]